MSEPGALVLLRHGPSILNTQDHFTLTGRARTAPLTVGGTAAMVSHRSGGTDDTFVADLAVGYGCGQLTSWAPARGEGVAKYDGERKSPTKTGPCPTPTGTHPNDAHAK